MPSRARDTHYAYRILTADPIVASCIRWMVVPGKILAEEETKHGANFVFEGECIVPPDEDYNFLVTLDALLAMGARVYVRLPSRHAPPEGN